MEYCLIKNDKIENVIVADATFISGFLPTSGYTQAVVRGTKGEIGNYYFNGQFMTPTEYQAAQ